VAARNENVVFMVLPHVFLCRILENKRQSHQDKTRGNHNPDVRQEVKEVHRSPDASGIDL